MTSRLRAWLEDLGDQFWLRPAVTVIVCLALAHGAILADRAHLLGRDFTDSLVYSGGAEGARSLLSSVASSAIGVASTIFSITIAALSLASGQMGPRLLRNFVRDSRNQYALGIFLGTFAYALIVLRTVRTAQEAAFVPNIAVTGALLLAMLCVGTLTWFVHHIATAINVERVVGTVHGDLVRAIATHTRDTADVTRPASKITGRSICVEGSDYVQAIDTEGLADWAHDHNVSVALRVRPGNYVPKGAPVAIVSADVEETERAIERAITFGGKPAALQDLEFSVRQLNEIAVRALSPGINDPFTAGTVLDRFGDGLCDALFHTIRQNATGSAYVLIRMLEVLARVAEVERMKGRRAELRRHGDLVMQDTKVGLPDHHSGRADLQSRFEKLQRVLEQGAAALTVQNAPTAED